MPVKVIYENDATDEVDPLLLDTLISSCKIKKFLRSEGWADITASPIRGKGGTYNGPERRIASLSRRTIRILLIEDNRLDAEVIREILPAHNGIHIDLLVIDRLSSALQKISEEKFDVILSDLMLPDSRGIETFVNIHTCAHHIPTIVLSGLDDKQAALDAVRKGAQDYLVKGHFDSDLLMRSILYAIERQELLGELEKRMNEIKTLRGMIPICATCKKIRDDRGYWKSVEEYISKHTDAAFTHGLCPDCAAKALSELDKK